MFVERTDESLWTTFWRETADGCTHQFPAAARAAISRRWRTAFAAVAAPARILDLASGRGAVLQEAVAAGAASRGACLLGVDRADVAATGNFRLLGGIDAAALPFGDRSFDLVTSQFGVEYAGFDAAVAEAGRVVRTRLLMLIHAAEGIVCRQMREQATQAEWLLGPQQLALRMRDGHTASLDAAIEARARSDDNYSLLFQVRGAIDEIAAVRSRIPPAELDEAVDDIVASLAGHRDRMRLLAGAAPDRDAVDRVAAGLREAAFTVSVEDARHGDLVGRWVDAHRA